MNFSKQVALGLMGALLALGSASAADADPGIFGPIDTGRFPKPKVINRKPIVIDRAAQHWFARPIYLHVPPGDEFHWNAHCHTYNACAVPVHFVTESWFVNTYLPAIGSRDGREQRYRMQAARERASERDVHDLHGDE